MVDHEAICARYALALTVIPDHDVAGDLFMEARSDSELLRLANQWRGRRALGEVTAAPPYIQPLTPEDQEHALHLYRRSLRKRRSRVLGYAAVASVALAGFALWVLPRPTRGLAAAEPFQGEMVQSPSSVGGYRVGLYRMEASAGQVTVWWQVTGFGADSMTPKLRPELTLTGATIPLNAYATEQEAPRHDRVFLKSSFKTYVTTADSALLSVSGPDGRTWSIFGQLEVDPEAVEQTVLVNQTALVGPSTVVIDAVTLSPTSTVVKYHALASPGVQPGRLMAVLHDGLQSVPPVSLGRGGPAVEDQGVFGPLPVGATELSLLFSGPVEAMGPQSIPLPSPSVTETRPGPGRRLLSVTLTGDLRLDERTPPYVLDAEGHRYEAASPTDLVTGSYTRFTVQLSGVPEGARLATLQLPLVYRSHPAGVVRVDLSATVGR